MVAKNQYTCKCNFNVYRTLFTNTQTAENSNVYQENTNGIQNKSPRKERQVEMTDTRDLNTGDNNLNSISFLAGDYTDFKK